MEVKQQCFCSSYIFSYLWAYPVDLSHWPSPKLLLSFLGKSDQAWNCSIFPWNILQFLWLLSQGSACLAIWRSLASAGYPNHQGWRQQELTQVSVCTCRLQLVLMGSSLFLLSSILLPYFLPNCLSYGFQPLASDVKMTALRRMLP